MKYKIVLFPSEEGYAVMCPALPGCASQGDTREEAIANIQNAIRDYLEVREEMLLKEQGEIAEVEVAC
jgi:predicted RNase H-like HicB family nuclease